MDNVLPFVTAWLTASWQLLLDSAPYLIIGLVLGGLLKVFLSPEYVARHLGRGRFTSVLKAALFGIPLPLCSCGVLPAAAALKRQGANNGATASTPISAALILKGGSPGAALVFLLMGPTTNIPTLSVLTGLLGKRATALYLSSVASLSIVSGLAVDWLYWALGIKAQAVVGQAAEIIPTWLQWGATMILLGFSVRPILGRLLRK